MKTFHSVATYISKKTKMKKKINQQPRDVGLFAQDIW